MRQEKQLLLEDIKDQIKEASSFFVTAYVKISANKANEFRSELLKAGSSFEVVPKRMFIKAAESLGLQFTTEELLGHIGIILSFKDPVETTKTLMKFSQKNNHAIQPVCGIVEGQRLTAQDVEKLATLPSKDQLRAEFLGLISQPMAGVVTLMDTLLTSVIHCIDNKVSKEETKEEAKEEETKEEPTTS